MLWIPLFTKHLHQEELSSIRPFVVVINCLSDDHELVTTCCGRTSGCVIIGVLRFMYVYIYILIKFVALRSCWRRDAMSMIKRKSTTWHERDRGLRDKEASSSNTQCGVGVFNFSPSLRDVKVRHDSTTPPPPPGLMQTVGDGWGWEGTVMSI